MNSINAVANQSKNISVQPKHPILSEATRKAAIKFCQDHVVGNKIFLGLKGGMPKYNDNIQKSYEIQNKRSEYLQLKNQLYNAQSRKNDCNSHLRECVCYLTQASPPLYETMQSQRIEYTSKLHDIEREIREIESKIRDVESELRELMY